MPKGGGSNEDRAKVKLRVIEFELEGGNASVENSIRQLTHALTTPRNGAPARLAPAKPQRELAAGASAAEPDEIEDTAQDAEYAEVEEAAPEAAAPSKPKKPTGKPRMPKYLHDLDLTGNNGPTFEDFARTKNPETNSQRHLVAAFWLKEYGGSETITVDKVYTCYRMVDWPTDMSDWDVNFRSQVPNDRFRRVARGEYAITPKGENDVRKLNGTE
jgi:hypothetical protein